ncbi:MAG: hypothetical protein IKW13_01115, partial [Thermoguttaceae bacterium]|nr:hypothetical protein [Thermoguttaceae bacterium]
MNNYNVCVEFYDGEPEQAVVVAENVRAAMGQARRLAASWGKENQKIPRSIKVEEIREFVRTATAEIQVDGVSYPFRNKASWACRKIDCGFECVCEETPQVRATGNTPQDAIRACQAEFARLFEETCERRFVDYSNATQALWRAFAETVDLVAYRKKKPTRWTREGEIVALDAESLLVEWSDGSTETLDLKKFPLPTDVEPLKAGDWAEFLIERDFFTAEPRKIASVKKFVREEYSL